MCALLMFDAPTSGAAMAIHTGLSVTVAGHLISLDRDESAKVVRLVVMQLDGHVLTGLEGHAVSAAAELLQRRAERFLGKEWTVIGWRQPLNLGLHRDVI